MPDTSPNSQPRDPIAWNPAELAENPHQSAEKAGKVRSMFASIAGSYDLNNRLHSFGLDQSWRKRTVALAGVRKGDAVLDMACGTGDLTEAFVQTEAAEVVGGDFTPEMLDQARRKAARLPEAARPVYEHADAMDLDYEDQRFDVVTIAFGIRNVTDPAAAIKEFARVLRPGGRLVILEFAEPRNPLVRWGNRFYTTRVMPWTASMVARDGSGAYRYLPRSIETFLDPQQLAELMRGAGLVVQRQIPLTFGVCVASLGVRES
ncbi:MAG: bifunctional demethylmenaquinone methyltransferase/2-methoxy-6-polyprenyl-1,4-benzoquinol methylase UbiE [Phycisphaerales bacterium]|jgi:demethylmenaquinone methyltransferase/2-methoxy-6-polyprenyl-1,4-benzoquinol methylase|nr:bifunctional demethylmenaquinone methyltransferase/2-methoxy-6-polyprenyl-1,4-benzoquinol methylase UbiE [Phycisphaerales bacterium]